MPIKEAATAAAASIFIAISLSSFVSLTFPICQLKNANLVPK
jgi:hypothetical protein